MDNHSSRLASYKPRGKHEIGQRKRLRRETTVQLRKQNRHKAFKLLRIPSPNDPLVIASAVISPPTPNAPVAITPAMMETFTASLNSDGPLPPWAASPEVINSLVTSDPTGTFKAAFLAKQLLPPLLVSFAHRTGGNTPSNQQAIVSVLARLAPCYTNLVVQCEDGLAVTVLLAFLVSSSLHQVALSIDTLQALARTATPILVSQGLLLSLANLIRTHTEPQILYRIASLLTTISRAAPLLPIPVRCRIPPLIHTLLLSVNDSNILSLTVEAALVILDTPTEDKLEFFFTTNCCRTHPVLKRIIDFLDPSAFSRQLSIAALHLLTDLSDFVTNNEFFECLLDDYSILDKLSILLTYVESDTWDCAFFPEDVLLLLDNLMGEGEPETTAVLQNSRLVKWIAGCLSSGTGNKPAVTKAVVWTVATIATYANEQDLEEFMQSYGIISDLVDLLVPSQDVQVLECVLQTIVSFMENIPDGEDVTEAIEASGGFDKLDELSMSHQNPEIRTQAEKVLHAIKGLTPHNTTQYNISLSDLDENNDFDFYE